MEILTFPVPFWSALVAVLGLSGFFGWRWRETQRKLEDMRRDIARLDSLKNQLGNQITNNVNVNLHMRDSQAGMPIAYDPVDGQMFFGTKHGDLRVRFHDADTIIEDIDAWLNEHGLKGRVSPDAVRTIMRRLKERSEDQS